MVSKALSTAGHNIHIYFVAPDHKHTSLKKVRHRLLRIPRVKVLSDSEVINPKNRYDRLIIQMFPRPHVMESCQMVHPLAECAERITLISAGDRSRNLRTAYKMQWRELRLLGKWIKRLDRIVYKDGYHPFDLFAPIKSRKPLGFNIHSEFMDDEYKFAYIQQQDWKPETIRPYSFNFMGSRDPDRRKRILDSIKTVFTESGHPTNKNCRNKTNIWHEFSDKKPNALKPLEFVDVLSNSDFTLCPSGYSLITHRLVESLLRGSIPILNEYELDIYEIGLKDGVNCIAAQSDNWRDVVERCFAMDEKEIVAMRKNIRSLVKDHILYPVSSKEMRLRLSVPD
jgi:hypothetical protein